MNMLPHFLVAYVDTALVTFASQPFLFIASWSLISKPVATESEPLSPTQGPLALGLVVGLDCQLEGIENATD